MDQSLINWILGGLGSLMGFLTRPFWTTSSTPGPWASGGAQ